MALFRELLLSVEPVLMPWSGLLTGLCSVCAVSTYRNEAYLRSEILTYGSLSGILGLLAWSIDTQASMTDGLLWGALCLIGIGLIWRWYRHGVQWVDQVHARLTRRSGLARVGRTDVRSVAASLPVPRVAYDPRKYYKAEASEEFFMGLNETGQPIYWHGRLPHVLIAGTTGSGKGRKLQCLSVQSIHKGELLVYLDPKNDEYAAHVIYAACQVFGKPYHYLLLLPESPVQINLLQGAKAWEIEELLISGLDLGDKGGPSDYYMSKNRKAAKEAARLASEEALTLAELHCRFANNDYWLEESPGFVDKLGELAGVEAINAKVGVFSLAEMMQSGGAVYVVGSMTLPAVLRAQQMIFVRIQQLASARDRLAAPLKTVCVIADEMRYHISKPIIQGLAASRDKGMRIAFAMQGLADVKDCPASMNPEMVEGALIENTRAKLVYQIEDPNTAEWLQRKSGIILVDDEAKVINRNVALAETTEGERTIRQSDHFLFDTNKLTNLPPGWGVLFGQHLAQACYVSPIPTEKCRAAVTPVAAEVQPDSSILAVESPRTPPAIPHGSIKSLNNDFFAME